VTAVLRAHHALQAAGLHGDAAPEGWPPAGHPERMTNAVNEVWRCGHYMVRINPHAGATRLQAEGGLLARLPPAVRSPVAVAAGRADWGEWLVTVRISGQELSRAWPSMRRGQRRRSITELATVLRALHETPAPTRDPPGARADCPHPLPADRLLRLLAVATEVPGVDRAVLFDAAERLAATAGCLDDTSVTLVHGDLHLENVLTGGDGEVTGLLDFEWARPGPPDLDLDVLLHSLADPELHVQGGDGARLHRRDFDEVVAWLRDAYPALFGHPRLAERLWVYRLAYDVQALVAEAPTGAPCTGELPAHHPYQRIVRLVEGRSDLGWFLAC